MLHSNLGLQSTYNIFPVVFVYPFFFISMKVSLSENQTDFYREFIDVDS